MHTGLFDAAKGKYWAVEVRGTQVLIRSGKGRLWSGKARLGSDYSCKLKVEKTEAKALAYAEKQVAATLKKGFEDFGVSESDPAADSLDFQMPKTDDVFFFLDRQAAGKLKDDEVQSLLRFGSSHTVAALVDGGLDLPPKTIVSAAQGDKTGAMVQSLLDAGADADFVGSMTPLGMAAQKGHAKTVEVLLRAGANVSLADRDGGTPTMHALLGNGKALPALLAQKPDLSAVSGSGKTALQIAINEALDASPKKRDERVALAQALVDAGSPITAEQAAVLKELGIEADVVAAEADQSLVESLLGAWKVDYVRHGRIRRDDDWKLTFDADGTFASEGFQTKTGSWTMAGSTVFANLFGDPAPIAFRGKTLIFRDYDEEHAQAVRYYFVRA